MTSKKKYLKTGLAWFLGAAAVFAIALPVAMRDTPENTAETVASFTQENALSVAERYAASPITRSDLVCQLEREGFTPEEVDFALQNLDGHLMTQTQEYAVRRLEQLCDYSLSSELRMIDQLMEEKFSYEDAVFAIELVCPDWSANALHAAEGYYDSYIPISESALLDQLKFDKFTPEQIEFAMENLDADWNASALRDAEFRRDTCSPDGLYDQLILDGFTAEQAAFAAEASEF